MAHFHNHSTKRRLHARTILFLSTFFITVFLIIYHSFLAPIFHLPPLLSSSLTSDYTREHNIYSSAVVDKWDQTEIRIHYERLTSAMLPPKPPPSAHDVCLLLGRNTHSWRLWQRNSRSVCVTSPVCIPTDASKPLMHTSALSLTNCRVVTPAYEALPAPLDDPYRHDPELLRCHELQHQMQLCPWPGVSQAKPKPCIPRTPTSQLAFSRTFRRALSSRAVFEGITLVVPNYPYPANIFHFAASIAMVAHAAVNIETIVAHYGKNRIFPRDAFRTLPLNVLFLSRRRFSLPWQLSLEQILMSGRVARVLPNGVRVSYLAEQSSSYVCVRNPVLMGQRGHTNAWPFPNATEIALDGSEVPSDAIDFRNDVYTALRLRPAPISRGVDGVLRIPPPPLVVGYSQRAGRESIVGMGVHAAGTVRRFSDEDEQWFSEMLHNETMAGGVGLQTFLTTAEDTFEHQVRRMEKIGFVVGIHGANLANCIFMRPFGALFEIFPANMSSSCYFGGSNSGLAYFEHAARVKATPQESGCTEEEVRCFTLARQRLVKIGTREDRDLIRQRVQQGIEHLLRLNSKYKNGVPVVYDRVSATYRIID